MTAFLTIPVLFLIIYSFMRVYRAGYKLGKRDGMNEMSRYFTTKEEK